MARNLAIGPIREPWPHFFDEPFSYRDPVGWRPFSSWPSIFEVQDRQLRPPDVQTDVSEDKDNIYVEMNVPGFEAEDLSVSLDQGLLTVSGERSSESKKEDSNYLQRERMVSSFERSIRIAAAIAEERIEAVLDNGVLSMTLPKAVEIEASKKIEIKKK